MLGFLLLCVEIIKKLFPAECPHSLQQWREYNGIINCTVGIFAKTIITGPRL